MAKKGSYGDAGRNASRTGGKGGAGLGKGGSASPSTPKLAWHCKWCIGSNGPWRNSGGLASCGKCGLPKGQCYKAANNIGGIANPATNLAQRGGAGALSSPERKELEELRRTAKGKAWGKPGAKGAEVVEVVDGPPAPLSLEEKIHKQSLAQKAWKQLRELQDSGVVTLGDAMVHFPAFEEVEVIEPSWENKVQKAKNTYNKVWNKLKSAKAQAVAAVQVVADLRGALQKALEDEKVADEAQVAAAGTFNEAAVALRAAEDDRLGDGSDEGEGFEVGCKRRRGRSKPDIPSAEVHLWDQFKAALGAQVRQSASSGECIPDLTDMSKALAAGLGELLAKQLAEVAASQGSTDDGSGVGPFNVRESNDDDGRALDQMEDDINNLDTRRKGSGKNVSRGQHGPSPYS
jgi:hypothetical protein